MDFCCNGCQFFVDGKCTEKDHKKHENDKSMMVQAATNEYLHATNEQQKENEKEFIDHINNYYLCDKFESRIPPLDWRINKSCNAYPCHENLEDCTFCYCPFYACGNLKRGRYLVNPLTLKSVWDCSGCEWIHKKSVVDKIFRETRKLLEDLEKDEN